MENKKTFLVIDKIKELEDKLGKLIPIKEIEKEFEGKIISDEINNAIDKLSASGEIFKPRRGYVQRV